MTKLISINQAAAQGIARLRMPVWAHPADHLRVDIIDGTPGPWIHLYSPFNESLNGRDPVDVLWAQMDCDDEVWIPHDGPLPGSPEYIAAKKAFA